MIRTIESRDLERDRSNLESDFENLVSDIPGDKEDDSYLDAVEGLADWLGLHESDHLEFFGIQPWLDSNDECLRWARDGSYGHDLNKLNELKAEVADFERGVTLINQQDFPDYARQYAQDIDRVDIHTWPFYHIDWDAAADELAQDYESVEYDGDTYLYRE